ncbi:transposase DDE domain protein [mine drainage metagenome]|uniref:Transposase DDE domain protein n=1 Tax=mine drainage metagenome TaxID=410659 RepID=A0A1J5QWA2_9ZZZZ
MMGHLKSEQGQLFYQFNLEDAVPDDHLVRRIDAALDLSWLRHELASHYSSMGRPSIDPELMIRMLVMGYVFAIRSERLICREVQVNLAYRWFCKLGIEDAIPDHSAFSRARNERFREGDVFRRLFERVVEACIAAGLVGGEGFAVDASLIQADANKQRSIAGQDWHRDRDPERSSRAVKEYLATLDDTAWGAASDVVPKFVSPSDPAAQWTGAHKGPAFFAYSDNYLIDVKFGVIVDVEASRSIRQAEVGAAKTMIERTEERFGLKPERLAADTAYGAAPMLNWLVEEKGIAPHIPVFDKSKRDDGTFSRSDFRYDPTSDVYHCPAGKTLTTTGTLVNGGTTLIYLARKHDCDGCKLRAQCCPKIPFRKIPRDRHEAARDVARSLAGTDGFDRSRRERKKIEMRFAHLKRILRLGRLRLRGPRGAQDEFVLAAIAQNLRRLASLVARPPPAQVLCTA